MQKDRCYIRERESEQYGYVLGLVAAAVLQREQERESNKTPTSSGCLGTTLLYERQREGGAEETFVLH